MVTEIPADKWLTVASAAAGFAKLSPWNWLADNQIFGFEHAELTEKGYCCVMGMQGDFKALAIYPGKEGWFSYHLMNSEQAPEDPLESVMAQRCLMVVFQQAADTDPQDLALLRHIGYPVNNTDWIPAFRSYSPGFLPWAPNLDEIKWLEYGLTQALALAISISAAPTLFPASGLNDEGKMLIRRISDNGQWEDTWEKPEPSTDLSPEIMRANAEIHQQIKQISIGEGIWLLEDFYMNQAHEEAERPFFPHALVLFDLETQQFRGISMLSPFDWPNSTAEVLLAFFKENGELPAQIVVSTKKNFMLFRQGLSSFGIQVFLEEEVNIKEELKLAVEDMLKAQA